MNIAMEMTVDALLRTLRGLAHGAADRAEQKPAKRTPLKPMRPAKEVRNERRR